MGAYGVHVVDHLPLSAALPRSSFSLLSPSSNNMPPTKRRKVASPAVEAADANESAPSDVHSVSEHEAVSDNSGSESEEAASSPDTEDELTEVKRAKSKKTLKRKRRATDATHFGTTLQTLLGTDAPSNLPLSLKPSIARKRNDEKLEFKGKKVLEVEKKEREEKGRIQDVIGGWGGESERALRKVAQRGGASGSHPFASCRAVETQLLNSCQALQRHTANTSGVCSSTTRSESPERVGQADVASPGARQKAGKERQAERQHNWKRQGRCVYVSGSINDTHG